MIHTPHIAYSFQANRMDSVKPVKSHGGSFVALYLAGLLGGHGISKISETRLDIN